MRKKWMFMRKKWIFLVPLALVAMAAFIAIGGEVVMLLWNGLLPTLFGWRQITFWQGLGMLALCRILFGGLVVLALIAPIPGGEWPNGGSG